MIKNFLKKKFNSIKICAVFTTVCFMVSTLGANLYAIPMAEDSNQKYEDVFNKASSISNEYGKITSSKDAQSDITVINIQDLHCHPQTQRNISKIIGQIADKYNLTKIFVEGGYGDIDVSWLNSIKDENVRKQVIEQLVEDGMLTGSEYYKLTSNNESVELKGIDEKQLHQDNIKRLSLIIENQDKYKELSKKINKEISFLEQRYVNIRNKRFNSSIEDYLSNKIDSKRFYRQLIKYVKDINDNPDNYNNMTAIRLEDYPNISKFMTLRKVSKNINVRDVTQQLQIVINELKNKLPYNTYTRLLKETENFSDSQKVVELVTLLCDKEGIDLDYRYKSLGEFLKSNEINRELNTVELVYEERQLITEIRKALSYNNEEYEITFISDFSRYFQDYLEYKLTDADWKYFESGYKQFRQLYGKYATVDRIEEIEPDIAELNKYYEINDIRNEIFVNNLLQDEQPTVLKQAKLRQDEEILKNSKEVIVAVTGGFHSQALGDILQAKEVNTIVITPSIFEGIEKATKQYKGIIKEQSKEFQHQALAYRILSNLENSEQKVIIYGVLKRLLGNNLKQMQEALEKDVDLDTLEKELQNLGSLSEQDQIMADKASTYLKTAIDFTMDLLPKEGGKTIFVPNVNEIILKVSKGLVNAGIFLSDGPIFSVEQHGLPDLKGVSAEYYSRMHYEIQNALFGFEDSSLSDEDKAIKYRKKKNRIVTREYIPQPNATKEQILMKLVKNNEYYYIKLSDIVTKYNLDVEKDINLLNLLANNLYLGDAIVDRIIYAVKKYNIDTDFKYEILVNYVTYFEDDNSVDLLFSLDDKNLELIFNVYTYEDITELEVLLSFSNLNEKLNKFREFYIDNLGLDVRLLDLNLFTIFVEQVYKIQNLSEEALRELISLDYYAISYILRNVSDSYTIEKIFEYAHKFNLSSKTLKTGGINENFKDIRYKAIIKYISLDSEELFKKLFNLNKKNLQVVVDSISDADFLRDYLLNDNKYCGDKTYSEIYNELLRNISSLNFRKIAVDNNYLSLKLLVDENFNNMVSQKISKTGDIISKYFIAIFVSRFIYDSLNNEVFDYDINSEEFKSLLQKILNIYSALLNEMGKISVFSKHTKIYALCNNEVLNNGNRRFDTKIFEEILSNFQETPDITNFDRSENENASDNWLDSFRKFGLYSDDFKNEKGYFVFMGHGGKEHLQTVSPRYNKIFKGEIIKADVTSESEFITTEQLADALFDLAIRQENKIDLRNITIDLSSCHSYTFARKVYSLLDQRYSEYKKINEGFVGTFPTIITATGLETELTYTIFSQNINNFHDAVISTLRNGKIEEYTLGMLAEDEHRIHESNITMFVSYNNSDIRETIDSVRKDIREFFANEQNKKEQESNVKENALKGLSTLSEDVVEGSILRPFGIKLADKAHIWEEIVFRYLPTVSILLGFVNPFIGLAIQALFILAHPITKWIAAKINGNKVGIKDLLKQVGKDIKNLSLPTLALMLPYVGSFFAVANPILELIISPAIFMFSDVIVKWITKKDSGRKITVDRTTAAVAIISSLISFVLATSIPVISPIINPIVITSTIKAGYLHYTYNNRQRDSDKLLKIIDNKEKTRNYLADIKLDDNIKNKIQRLCNKNDIDLSENKLLQEILFTHQLCFLDEQLLEPLFQIKIDGKNSELKEKVLRKYLDASGTYYISDRDELSLLRDLINDDNNELILNYLLNHSIKDFVIYFLIYKEDANNIEDFLNKIKEIISLTEGKVSEENLCLVAINYDTYVNNINKFIDKNDKNYNLKCAILAKYIEVDFSSQSNIDTIEWLFATNHNGFLTYILHGLDFDSIMLEDFFVDDNGNSIYENKDFDILNKYLPEIESLLISNPDSGVKFEMLISILDYGTQINGIKEKDFSLLFFIYLKNSDFPFSQIMKGTKDTKGLTKYIELIEEYDLGFERGQKVEDGEKVWVDYRWKIALDFLNIEKNIKGKLFQALLGKNKYLFARDIEENQKEARKVEERYKQKYRLFEEFPKDSTFFKDYLFNEKYQDVYPQLIDSLISFDFRGIASENDFLALKLLVNKDFNEMLDNSGLENISKNEDGNVNIIARYYSAIAVSRFIYDSVGGEISKYDLSDEYFIDILKDVTSTYIEIMKEMLNVTLIDKHTKIYALCNSEMSNNSPRFNTDALKEILDYMGFPEILSDENVYKRADDDKRTNGKTAKRMWLDAIANFKMDSAQTKGYFLFRGHGENEGLEVYSPKRNNGNVKDAKFEEVSVDELVESLAKLAKRVDLSNITIDLSCCHSYFFARKVYKLLEQKGITSYPTIITAAGLETKFGVTDITSEENTGNLHKGIKEVLGTFQKGTVNSLSLGMLGVSEYLFRKSNITMFSSSFNGEMSNKIQSMKKKAGDSLSKYSKEKQYETEEQKIQKKDNIVTKLGIETLPIKVVEASIFSKFKDRSKIFETLDATAHIWEEIPYRLLPTLLIIGLQSVLLPVFGTMTWLFVIPAAFGIFYMFQKHFIRSHIITDWLNTKKQPNEITSWKELMSFLYGRFKIYAFNIFPTKGYAEEFKNIYETDDDAVAHKKGLTLPTIFISLPYLIMLSFMIISSVMPSTQLVLIVTVAASLIHYINNKFVSKGVNIPFLQERQKEKNFRHIKGRLEYVRLIMEYPEIKNTLSVSSEGPKAEKYGMDGINGRRFLYSQQFLNVKGRLLKKVEDRMTTIKNDIQKLGQKSKNREKLENLSEELKKYLRIRNELDGMSESKFLEIVDNIYKFLSIFEEVDDIISLIEEYKKNYEGTKEAKTLERDFAHFVSNVLAKKLISSVYDRKNVTRDHVTRALYLANTLGEYMQVGSSLKFKYELMLSALFHDIGKNLIPYSILNSQNSLDELEKDIMDFHSVFGYMILKSSILHRLAYCAGEHHNAKKSKRGYGYKTKIEQINETPFGFEYGEQESKILEIIALADVYEAVSPKLSINSERNYQMPRKVQFIKDILEESKYYWTATESQSIIRLMDEINMIDTEKDEASKQEMERIFVEEVLYEYSNDPVLKYIRGKNNEKIRERAFEIIFTRTPEFIFDAFSETEKEFIDEFLLNTEVVKDICLDLADKSKLEFDDDVLKAFLELYFTDKDIEINNKIIDEMGYQKKESLINVLMRRILLRFDRDGVEITQRLRGKAGERFSKYKPVRASIFGDFTGTDNQTEETKQSQNNIVDFIKGIFKPKAKNDNVQQELRPLAKLNLDFENINKYYDIGKDKIEQNFIVNIGDNTYFITLNIVSDTDIYFTLDYKDGSLDAKDVGKVTEYLGIDFKVSDDKKSLYLVKTDNFNESTKIYPLNGHLDISFQDMYEPVSIEFEKNIDFSDSEISAIEKDTGTTTSTDIYLDDYLDNPSELQAKIKQASENNELIVIHFFRNNNYQTNLTYEQILSKYAQVSKLIYLFSFYGQDSEFLISEILKNAFVHGNFCKFEEPIAFYIKVNNDGTKINKLAVYNKKREQKENMQLKTLAAKQELTGQHFGIKRMKENENYDFVSGEVRLDEKDFYKASAEFSVLEEEVQTDFEKYFKDKKVLIQRFKTEEGVRRVKGFEILNFDKNSIKKIVGRFEVPVFERNYDLLGIIVEKDSDGNIVSVKAKEGYEFSSLLIDGEPVGDEKNNLNFSLGQISAMLKDVKILDYDAPDIKEDEMDKYVAHIYLDDSKEELEKAMEEAIKNNKLMVIHVFRKGFSTESLTLGQIRDKYAQAYSLLQSDKLKNLPILSEMIQLEKDVEVASYINCDFFLKELLKNHFGHGNLGLFEYPIACYISADGSKMVTYDSSLDLGVGEYRSPFLSEEFKNRGITRGILEELMNVTLIHGDGKGRKMMAESKTRNFEDSRNVNDSKISGYRFFKAMVTLKLETEEQIEAAKQYKKEQDAKARTSMSLGTSASTEDENLYSFGTSSSKTLSSVSKATEEDWADFWGDSILPENIVMVNKLLQFGKSALKVATWVALQEADFSLSMEQDENGEYVFVNAHGDNTKGAIELENFIEHWRNKTRWLNKVAPRIAKTIVKQASIVKHISIDYRFIKASGIREAIKLFGERAKINEDGQIEVTIVDGIEQLQDSFTLINTGLKIEGSSIYRVKDSNLLIYGAKGQQSIKVAKTLDGSDILNKDIMEMIKSLGQQVDEIQTQGIIRKEGEGLSISEDILEIGELELQGKTTQQISQFIASGLEVKRAIGIMYGQKTIIDLKAVTDIEKLRATVYNGRARKVISKRQYDNLNLSKEDMEKLKEAGIEIYIDNGEEVLIEKEIEGYKRNGVAGQVIRDEKGVRIRDYKVEGEIEIKEILEVKDIEREIITSEKPVMIGINILTEHFKQGNITNIQREFGALLGKIKMTFNIGELNRNDIESMGYNISFERIPQLSKEEIGRLFDNGEIADKERIIEVIGADTEFGIVLRTIKNKETEERFRQIIVERILAKEKLVERGNVLEGTELREKNMEKVLGQMLKRQIEQRYVEKEAKMEGITKTNAAEELMKAIERLKELDKEGNKEDTAEQTELVNNIIEIILYDGERIKKEQMQQQADTGNMAKSYRSMLAAA